MQRVYKPPRPASHLPGMLTFLKSHLWFKTVLFCFVLFCSVVDRLHADVDSNGIRDRSSLHIGGEDPVLYEGKDGRLCQLRQLSPKTKRKKTDTISP